MTRILVTGARGAIGRRVVRLANARGHQVAGIGHGNWDGDADLPPIEVWINGSVTSANLEALASRFGTPDVIVHLAGGSSVGPSVERPAEDFERTVIASQQLLEWMRRQAPRSDLVIASSAAIYGGSYTGPIDEIASRAPTSPYGTHKAIAELLGEAYGRQFGMKVVLLRLFSVYGPGLRKQIVWDLARRLVEGDRTPRLGGSGRETRDFLHIDDAAAMLIDAAHSASPSVPTLNGCTGRAISIKAAADAIARNWPDAKVEFSGEMRAGDPMHLVGSTVCARAAGLEAKILFEQGLEETVRWIKAN